MENQPVPGKGLAVGSLVCGIISVVLWWFGYSALVSVILGIVGIVLAVSSRKQGFEGGIRTGGLVLSIIGIVGGCLFFVACTVCTCIAGQAVGAAGLNDLIRQLR